MEALAESAGADESTWYYSKEKLYNTPSRRDGIDADKELSYRQQAANLIQDMGQKLQVSQLCINTAIVYMHRFYMYHSMVKFHRNALAPTALFLAAKVEEQPRKMEHVIRVAHICLYRNDGTIDPKSEAYQDYAQDLVFNESVLLQTLGFNVCIDHPHTHVVKCCQLVKASKDLAQTSYFMASNSLHLTTMCLQYRPSVVACFCIHLACKWSNWEIPKSSEGKDWFWYVDQSVTSQLLQKLTKEFLHIFDKAPSRLKKKMMNLSANQSPNMPNSGMDDSLFEAEPRQIVPGSSASSGPSFTMNRPGNGEKPDEKKGQPPAMANNALAGRQPIDFKEYRERKEREKNQVMASSFPGHSSTSSTSSSDPNKHLVHNHKQPFASGSGSAVSKHHPQVPGSQKVVHPYHNHHHHKPEMKNNQTAQQRLPGHSYGQPGYGNSHMHRPSTDVNKQHVQPLQAHDKHRSHEMRHKQQQPLQDHRPKPEGDVKMYPKYPEAHKIDRPRKTESLDQRSEEVRKLIEKPVLPMVKPQHKEEYVSHIPKQPFNQKPPNAFVQDNMLNSLSLDAQKRFTPNPQYSALGVSQILKDGIKNSNSRPLPLASTLQTVNVLEDTKLEQQQSLQTPPSRQRSLFSPEKISPVKQPQNQINKYKQMTPPMTKVPKPMESLPDLDLGMSFTDSQSSQRLENHDAVKRYHDRTLEEDSLLHDISKVVEVDNGPLGHVFANGQEDMFSKPEDMLDPFGPQEIADAKAELGFQAKPPEYLSPLKSAQSISALLQEPLATIPSFLQEPLTTMPSLLPEIETHSPEQVSMKKDIEPSWVDIEKPKLEVASTVDLRELAIPLVPIQQAPVVFPTSEVSTSVAPVNATVDLTAVKVDEKSEHHKSEKKKEKKKHKHKDKEKSKEKHKHRHKDKDKEKRKEKVKEKVEESKLVAAPIKIKIPKEKLGNFSSEMPTETNSVPKLRIHRKKLAKIEDPEVIQVQPTPEPVMQPLKIVIDRRMLTHSVAPDAESRKRERSDSDHFAESSSKRPATSNSSPPSTMFQQQEQQQAQRQNGRHYNSSNKEKHSLNQRRITQS